MFRSLVKQLITSLYQLEDNFYVPKHCNQLKLDLPAETWIVCVHSLQKKSQISRRRRDICAGFGLAWQCTGCVTLDSSRRIRHRTGMFFLIHPKINRSCSVTSLHFSVSVSQQYREWIVDMTCRAVTALSYSVTCCAFIKNDIKHLFRFLVYYSCLFMTSLNICTTLNTNKCMAPQLKGNKINK